MSTSKKPNPLRAVLMVLLMASAGAGAGFLVARYGIEVPFVRSRLTGLNGWDLLALPVLGLLVIAVHEGGHLLGGMRRGMRFLLYIAGPFQWSRGESGVHFSWAFNLGTLGGVAACTPDPDRPAAPQLRWMVAGGPLASLLLAFAGVGFAALVEGRPAAYALIVGLLSLAIFCVTAVPMRAGGFMSDGMQFLELLRGGRAVEERNVLMAMLAQSLAGVRPALLDPRLLAQALAFVEPEPLRAVAARLYAFLHAWDSGDDERTRAHAEWLAEHIGDYPDGFRQSLAIELALYAALERSDAEATRGWLLRSRGGVVEASRRALAEAAFAALEEDDAEAEAQLAAAERALPRGMDRGLAQFSRSQIEALRRTLRDRAASAGMSQIVAKAV
jgi:hypothetical protein